MPIFFRNQFLQHSLYYLKNPYFTKQNNREGVLFIDYSNNNGVHDWVPENGVLTCECQEPLWSFPTWMAPQWGIYDTPRGYIFGSAVIPIWTFWFLETMQSWKLKYMFLTEKRETVMMEKYLHNQFWTEQPHDIDWRWMPVWIPSSKGERTVLRSPLEKHKRIPIYINARDSATDVGIPSIQTLLYQWIVEWNKTALQHFDETDKYWTDVIKIIPWNNIKHREKIENKMYGKSWFIPQTKNKNETQHTYIHSVLSPACKKKTLRMTWNVIPYNQTDAEQWIDMHICPVENIQDLQSSYTYFNNDEQAQAPALAQQSKRSNTWGVLRFKDNFTIPCILWIGQGWEFIHTSGNHQRMLWKGKLHSQHKLDNAWRRLKTWMDTTEVVYQWCMMVKKEVNIHPIPWIEQCMKVVLQIKSHPWYIDPHNKRKKYMESWFKIMPDSYCMQFDWFQEI